MWGKFGEKATNREHEEQLGVSTIRGGRSSPVSFSVFFVASIIPYVHSHVTAPAAVSRKVLTRCVLKAGIRNLPPSPWPVKAPHERSNAARRPCTSFPRNHALGEVDSRRCVFTASPLVLLGKRRKTLRCFVTIQPTV